MSACSIPSVISPKLGGRERISYSGWLMCPQLSLTPSLIFQMRPFVSPSPPFLTWTNQIGRRIIFFSSLVINQLFQTISFLTDISVIPLALILVILLFLGFWRKRAVLLNLPKAGTTTSGASRRYPPELIDLDYHSGHIVPVPRTAPPVPSRHAPNAPPLPPLPPAYNDIIDNTAAENAQPL